MRTIYVILAFVLVICSAIFAWQNSTLITVEFLSWSVKITLPILIMGSVLVGIIFMLFLTLVMIGEPDRKDAVSAIAKAIASGVVLGIIVFGISYYTGGTIIRGELQKLKSDIQSMIEKSQDKTGVEVSKVKVQNLMLKAKDEVLKAKVSVVERNLGKAIDELDAAKETLNNVAKIVDEEKKKKVEKLIEDISHARNSVYSDSITAKGEIDLLWQRMDEIVNE